MSRTRIKFCGITRAADADAAAALGADLVGLVLDPGSPRFIELSRAAMIRARLPQGVLAVALLRNAAAADVRRAVETLQPDLLQFHGEEPAAFCDGFGVPYWRAVPMQGGADLAGWQRQYAGAAALLLDAHRSGERGGQGKVFDWAQVPARRERPIVLAGGLTPDNVAAAVRTVRPWAVDVSSGIESGPGIKDQEKMRRFVEAVRKADRET